MNKVRPIYIYICLALIILAGAGLLAFKPFSAEAAVTHSHTGWKEWTSNSTLPTEPGNYYLTEDVKCAAQWKPAADINICLNGYTVSMTYSSSSWPFYVNSGRTINVYNCKNSGYIQSSLNPTLVYVAGTLNIHGASFAGQYSTVNGVVRVAAGGDLTIEDGTFYNSNKSYGNLIQVYGNAVINGGTFTNGYVNALTVYSGGTATINGGSFRPVSSNADIYANVDTVAVESGGELYINGGTITEASPRYTDYNALYCEGYAEINGNATLRGNGDTVRVNSKGTVNINGGTISSTNSNGVYIAANGNATIKGGTISSTNSSSTNCNGVYIAANGNATINGGTISSTGSGSGVYAYGNATINGGKISSTSGKGVYVLANGNVTINGGTISSASSYPIWVAAGGKLYTNKASISASKTTIVCEGYAEINGTELHSTSEEAVYIQKGGEVYIKDGTISSGSDRAVAVSDNGGTLTVDKGTFSNNTATDIIYIGAAGKATITGGTINIAVDGANGIKNAGTLNMTGGKIVANGVSRVWGVYSTGSGVAEIKNVTVSLTGGENNVGVDVEKGGTITISDCNITSSCYGVEIYSTGGTLNMYGSSSIKGDKADIHLNDGQYISVTGTLRNTAPYSVLTETNPTSGSPVVITNSATTSYNDKTKFTAANRNYSVRQNSKNQLEIADVQVCTVTFDANGGTLSGSTTKDYELGEAYGTLPTPARTNYKFDGWYTSKTGGTEVKATDTVSKDTTIYAHWLEEYEQYGTPAVTLTYGNSGTLDMKNYIRTADTKKNIANGDFTFSMTNTINAAIDPSTGVITIPGTANASTSSYTLTVTAKENTIPTTLTISVSVTVDKADIEYSAPTANNRTYDGESGMLLAEKGSVTTSGGTITYKLDGSNDDYSAAIPTATDAGTYTVLYRVAVSSNYNTVESSVAVTIDRAASQVTKIPEPLPREYDGAPHHLVSEGSGIGGTMVYCVDNENGVYSEAVPERSAAGTYTVWYKVRGDQNHNDTAPASVQVTISAVSASFGESRPRANDLTYNGVPQQLLADGGSAPAGGRMMYSLDRYTGYTYNYSDLTGTNAGEYKVWYMVEGDSDHNDIYAEEPVTVIIEKADSEVTIPPVGEAGLVYTGTEYALIVNESDVRANGGALKYSINNEDYADSAPRRTDAGEYTVWYKVFGDSNHNDTDPVSVTVIIEQADLPDLAYEIPAGLGAVVGQSLSDVELPHGFTWKDPSRIIDEPVGQREFEGIYTPDDRNYKSVEIQIPVTVEKAPDASINYFDETLVTAAGTEYSLSSPVSKAVWTLCPADMPLESIGWDGSERIPVYVRNAGSITGAYSTIIIPTRPDAPDTEKMRVLKSDTSITVLNTEEYDGCEFAVNDESSWQADASFGGLKPGQDCTVYVYLKATEVSFRSNPASRDVVTVNQDGSTELRPGETVETENGGTITNNGDDITITDGDGNTTTIIPPEPGDLEIDPDGNVFVPEGSSIRTGDDVINAPEGGGTYDPSTGKFVGKDTEDQGGSSGDQDSSSGDQDSNAGDQNSSGGTSENTGDQGGSTEDQNSSTDTSGNTGGNDGSTGGPGGGAYFVNGGDILSADGGTPANAADSNAGHEEDVSAAAAIYIDNDLIKDTVPGMTVIIFVLAAVLIIRKKNKT